MEFKVFDRPGGGLLGSGQGAASPDVSQAIAELDARVTALERRWDQAERRSRSSAANCGRTSSAVPTTQRQGNLQERMASGDRDAKIAFDNLPPA